jgi:serpin B
LRPTELERAASAGRPDSSGGERWAPFGKILTGGKPALQLLLSVLIVWPILTSAATFEAASKSTNEFGLQLYQRLASGDKNVCISPYSISCALAMTLTGADGETRAEMARLLHVDPNADVDASFAALQKSLGEMTAKTLKIADASKTEGGPSEPITIAVANRLFPQAGYQFRKEFFARLRENYGAEPEPLDFEKNAVIATKEINDWVAKQTRDRIRDLIPQTLDKLTRLVLANAIYLKAPWASEFSDSWTKPESFHVNGGNAVDVSTMNGRKQMGYAKRNGYTTVAIPYTGAELQLVVFLPDEINGLHSLEKKLTAQTLAQSAKLESVEVELHLPKFKFEPPTVKLASELQALGMRAAFDIPQGSANFDRIAPRKPNEYLAVSDVFHKTFIAVDEKGTEAAAATAVAIFKATAMAGHKPQPIEVKIDRPFFYAIQHVPSGACLFMGRVPDPR